MRKTTIFWMVLILGCAAPWVRSADSPGAGAQRPLNDLLADRMRTEQMILNQEKNLETAWLDETNTSEEIVALRKKAYALEIELARTRQELRTKVDALPAIQQQRESLNVARVKADALARQIENHPETPRPNRQ